MTITSGIAATWRAALASAGRVLLTGPTDPDGDSIGACLALARLARGFSGAEFVVAGRPGYRYAWMPGADAMVPDDAIAGAFDLAVVLDGDRRRLEPAVARAFDAAGSRGLVDHHGSTDPSGYDLVYLDRGAASTCEMIVALADAWEVALDADLASLLYAGLIFDTGGFRHSNTTPASHRLAARLLETGIDHAAISVRILAERTASGLRLLGHVLDRAAFVGGGRVALASISRADAERIGADPGDTEGIVDALLYTRGVSVACLAVEKGPGRVKLSLRSRARIDVARFAREMDPGGGGHARAAGVLLQEDLGSVLERLPAELTRAVGG